MDRKELISALDSVKAEDGAWIALSRVSEIMMKDGSAYYPSLRHIRFRVNRKKGRIDVLYGEAESYGDSLISTSVSYDLTKIRAIPSQTGRCPLPKPGDFVRVTRKDGTSKDYPIVASDYGSNMMVVTLASKIDAGQLELGNLRFSYYIPEMEKPIHSRGTDESGVYVNFIPNRVNGAFGRDYHERIKCSDIAGFAFV